MGRRLTLAVVAGLLGAVTGCSNQAANTETETPYLIATADHARHCESAVLEAVSDKVSVDAGKVTGDGESIEYHDRQEEFASRYHGTPEMSIAASVSSDAIDAVNHGVTVPKSIAASTDRIHRECADAYPGP